MALVFKSIILILAALTCCESVFVQPSFWAPLFNPRILNYRVDATFDPNAGQDNRELFEKHYGYRGQNLIADLGNGQGPPLRNKDQDDGEVRVYYTYPGADQNQIGGIK